MSLGPSADRVSNVGTFVGYGEPVKPAGRASEVKEVAVTKASSFPPPAYKPLNKGLLFGIGAAAALAIVGVIAVVVGSDSKAEAPATEGAEVGGSALQKSPRPDTPSGAPDLQRGPSQPVPGAIPFIVNIQLDPPTAELVVKSGGEKLDCDNGLCRIRTEANATIVYEVTAKGYRPSGERSRTVYTSGEPIPFDKLQRESGVVPRKPKPGEYDPNELKNL